MSEIQIIATLGPATNTAEIITEMITSGLSIARLNFSWGTHEEHRHFIEMVRTAATECGKVVPIIQDLSGPRIQHSSGHTFDGDITVLTAKDQTDVIAFTDLSIEYIALSFVRDAADVTKLQAFLKEIGSTAKIIAKIERQEALNNLDDIIAVSDGIMIARGDLSEAVSVEMLPFIKKDILKRCNTVGKPAIVATGMLTSMIAETNPSQADITDVAQAVLDGAAATMLSNETAVGINPAAAVAVMRKVANEAQRHTETLPAHF